jgi:hypothetical protein
MAHFLLLNRAAMVAALVVVGIVSALQAQTITKFEFPNSTSTQPTAINSSGQITGIFQDATGTHGFVRQAHGALTAFDVPNNDPVGAQLIGVTSMNAAGRITGYMFLLDRSKYASFVRENDGTFTVVLEPPECRPATQGLIAPAVANIQGIAFAGINNRGQITGICGEFPPFDQSFLRQPDGTIAVFTVPVDGPVITRAQAINARGQVTGYYFDHGSFHGFLRELDGTITTFDASDSGTSPTAITPGGEITGEAGGHGFLRRRDGSIVTFDPPNSVSTQPTAINPEGQITGIYLDASFAYHGFLRDKHGTITTFDVPNATETYPVGMNPRGDITGWYSDASGGVHGFVREGSHKSCGCGCRK